MKNYLDNNISRSVKFTSRTHERTSDEKLGDIAEGMESLDQILTNMSDAINSPRETLPMLNSIKNCKKCGAAYLIHIGGSDPPSANATIEYDCRTGTMIRTCGICGYAWHEACIDSESQQESQRQPKKESKPPEDPFRVMII